MGKRLAGEEESSQVGPGGQLRGGENLGLRQPQGAPWIALGCGKAAHLCSEGTTESTQAPYVPTVW